MKTFREFLTEIIDQAFKEKKIMTNPSMGKIEAALKNSSYGELRYLHNSKTGDTHVGDAGHFDHTDIANKAGETGFNRNFEGEPTHYNLGHFRAGHIHSYNIARVKQQGLKGYIQQAHHGLPED